MVWLKQNLGYKLLALALSTVLWAYVHVSEGPVSRHLPERRLQLRGLPAGRIARPERDRVELILTGPSTLVEAVTDEEVEAWIDVKDAPVGRAVHIPVNCSASHEGVVLGCAVLPDHLAVRVDARISRAVPVSIFVTGTPPLGYTYARPQAIPADVTITGAKDAVNKVDRAVATAASMGKDVNQPAAVLALDARGNTVEGVVTQPTMVQVRAPLRLEPASKELLTTVRTTGHPAPGYSVVGLSVLPLQVIARGEAAALANLRSVKTNPVDLTGIETTRTMRVGLQAIPGVDLEPPSVNVQVEVRPVAGPVPSGAQPAATVRSGRRGIAPRIPSPPARRSVITGAGGTHPSAVSDPDSSPARPPAASPEKGTHAP